MITNCKTLFCNICNFFFHSLLYKHPYSVMHTETLDAHLQSCQKQLNSSLKFFPHVSSLNISFYPLMLFGFQFHSSLVCLLCSWFFHFTGPKFSKHSKQ
jgi:hypothetical protein